MKGSLAAAITLAALLAPAAAHAGDVQVINARGDKQTAFWTDDDGEPRRLTDIDGRITGLPAGTRVRVTRSTRTDSCFGNPGGAPEGPAGMAIDVPAEGTAVLILPNATGDMFAPESSVRERWIVGQMNVRRKERGKPPLAISPLLNRAASAVARRQAAERLSFPPPYCPAVVADWGYPGIGAYNIAGIDAGGEDPRAAWAHWSDGSPRETVGTLGDKWNLVGIGEGAGAWVAYFAHCPQELYMRCELSADFGDPRDELLGPPSTDGVGTGRDEPPPKTPPSGGSPQPGTAPGAPPVIRGLTVARRQRGRSVKATVDVGHAGSTVVARLKRGRRVVGKAVAHGVPAGPRVLRVKLTNSGRRALTARGKLRLTLEAAVDPPTAPRQALTRRVLLRR